MGYGQWITTNACTSNNVNQLTRATCFGNLFNIDSLLFSKGMSTGIIMLVLTRVSRRDTFPWSHLSPEMFKMVILP